jgi:ABC-type sugar transport system ATPase subunit
MLAGAETPDLTLEIEIIEKLGSDSYLYGRLPDGTPMTVRSPLENPAERNQRLGIRLDRGRLHLFDKGGNAIRP